MTPTAQAWLVRVRFRDEAAGSAAPWLFGIARNVLLMSARRGAIERRAAERLRLMGRLDHAPATSVDVRRTALPVRTRRRRRTVVALVTAVIAIPGVAVAAKALLSPAQVAQSSGVPRPVRALPRRRLSGATACRRSP